MKLPDFDMVNDVLHRYSADLDAAELHGQLCGMLCTLSEVTLDVWLPPCLPEEIDLSELPADAIDLFQEVLMISRSQISEGEFDFELLLPSDDTGLMSRIEALASWCQGYLLGITHGGVANIETLPGDLPEFVNDLINIGRAENYDLEDEDEDETAYMELVEYVRVGVQLFYEELHSQDPEDQAGEPILH